MLGAIESLEKIQTEVVMMVSASNTEEVKNEEVKDLRSRPAPNAVTPEGKTRRSKRLRGEGCDEIEVSEKRSAAKSIASKRKKSRCDSMKNSSPEDDNDDDDDDDDDGDTSEVKDNDLLQGTAAIESQQNTSKARFPVKVSCYFVRFACLPNKFVFFLSSKNMFNK